MRVMNITVQIPTTLRANMARVVRRGFWGANESQVASRFVLERLMEVTGGEPEEIEGFNRGSIEEACDDDE